MDTETKSTALDQASYEDFVPTSMWTKGERSDKLTIQLPGFKKEHLKVQLDNYGNLRVSGMQPLDINRWRRLRKEFRIPDDCNSSEIRAQFENGILTITLPKFVKEAEPVQVTLPQTEAQEPQTIHNFTKAENKKGVDENVIPNPETKSEKQEDMKGLDEKIASKGKVEEVVKEAKSSGLLVGMKRKPLLLNIVVAAIVLVGIGIYVAYKFRKVANDLVGEQLHFDEL